MGEWVRLSKKEKSEKVLLALWLVCTFAIQLTFGRGEMAFHGLFFFHFDELILTWKGPSYGLSAELEEKKKSAYDPQYERWLKHRSRCRLENEARVWIERMTGEKLGPNFAEALKSGAVLCKWALCEFVLLFFALLCPLLCVTWHLSRLLVFCSNARLANAVKPGSVRKINNGRMPFMLMVRTHERERAFAHALSLTRTQENIGFFLDAVTASGIVPADKFQTVDLYEAKNMVQVVRCIHAYARANGHNITSKGQRDPNSDLLWARFCWIRFVRVWTLRELSE
jgi:hypothetical protein